MVGPSRTSNTGETGAQRGPANCGTRGRAEDAADVVREMASTMRKIDPDLVKRLVIARNAATNIQAAFPEGDQRFEDSDDDSGTEEVVEVEYGGQEPEIDDSSEHCHGLLDTIMDTGPLQCLQRAKEDYGFDLVAEMDAAGLDFFERIRLANFIRKEVATGQDGNDVVEKSRSLLQNRNDPILKDDARLEPVIEGDLLLTVLESEQQMDAEQNADEKDVSDAVESSLLEENVLPGKPHAFELVATQ